MSWALSDSYLYSILNAMNNTLYQRSVSMLRLSTGSVINSASDDPDGIIALSNLNSELTAVQSASNNAVQANAMLEVADGGLSEISSLVSTIYSLTVELANDSGLTDSEREAKQLEIDQAIASIDSIVNTTTYNGQTLLNGNYEIRTTGVDSNSIADVEIYSQGVISSGTLEVDVISAAERAEISHTGSHTISTSATIEISGNRGSVTLTLSAGMSLSAIASAVNQNSSLTGVMASASDDGLGNYTLTFRSEDYGSDEFVSVDVISGTFSFDGGVASDYGEDANVTVNGQSASVDGYNVAFNVNGMSGHLVLSESFATSAGSSTSFSVTGGGASFALSPDVADVVTIGIPNMSTSNLGNGVVGYLYQIASGGEYSAVDNPEQAVRIAEAALSQVSRVEASVGAFQSYTIGSMENVLSSTETALSSAVSNINDTDYATEVANLTRQQMLYQYQTLALGLLTQTSSTLLSLLEI